MKQIALLAFICIATTACEKKEQCWSCNYRTEELGNDAINTRIEYCDKTEAEIRDMEKNATYVTSTGSTYMVCGKEEVK